MFKLIFFFISTFSLSFFVQGQNSISERHVVDAALSGADGVRMTDENHDGLMDIATGWEESGYTKIYLHPGYSRVVEKWLSVIAGRRPSVEDAVLMDPDSNGVVDVISSTDGNSLKIYIHWAPSSSGDYLGSAKWTSEILPASENLMQWMFAVPAQLDRMNGRYLVILVMLSNHINYQI